MAFQKSYPFTIFYSAAHPNAKLETSLHLAHTGDIYYVPAYVIQTYCDVNESIHVGDHVECKIVFGSWLYDANEVDIQVCYPVFITDLSDLKKIQFLL